MGSACYSVSGFLFSGDTLFIEGGGGCHFYGGSAEMMYESLQYLKKRISDDTLVFPGHRYKSEVGQKMGYIKKNNTYFFIKNVEQFIKMKNRYNKKNSF